MTEESCRPPRGSTYLTIGQDLFSIQEYVTEQYNASLHRGSIAPMSSFFPAAAMVYTDIQTLRGLDHPVDYGSGIEFADGIVSIALSPRMSGTTPASTTTVGLQIGLWLNGTAGCNDIVDGTLEEKVDALMQYLLQTTTTTQRASKIFLRVGYEFDNPDFRYDDPEAYKNAFRHLVRECNKHDNCKEKVAFVWHSWAAKGFGPLEAYYPGDEYVDWIGVSIFDQYFPWNPRGAERADIVKVLEFAKAHHDKPTMICESTPFGGIDLPSPYNETANSWDRWFQPTLDLIEEYDIGMWSYINCDWESQPMWHNIGFGETRLSTNHGVMNKWHEQVLQNDRFLMKLGCSGDEAPAILQSRLTVVDDSVTPAEEWQFSGISLLLCFMTICSLYMWKHWDDLNRRQLDEEQRLETQTLMHMIRYGSTP